MGQVAMDLGEHLFVRAVTIVRLDAPLLLISDEPVVVYGGESDMHAPECALTAADRKRASSRAMKKGRTVSELIHLKPTRPSGVAFADALVLPIAADRLLALGPKHEPAPLHISFSGDDARKVASDVNQRIIEQAFLWVAGSPDHPTLRSLDLPDRGPLFTLCNHSSDAAALAVEATPTWSLQRLRHWAEPGGASDLSS